MVNSAASCLLRMPACHPHRCTSISSKNQKSKGRFFRQTTSIFGIYKISQWTFVEPFQKTKISIKKTFENIYLPSTLIDQRPTTELNAPL